MKIITTKSKNKIFEIKIDDNIYEQIKNFHWGIATYGLYNKISYAISFGPYGRTRPVFLHRYIFHILGLLDINDETKLIDHEDNNGLNCQLYNMKIVTHSLNSFNSRMMGNNNSGYCDICWNSKAKKWHVYIRDNYRNIYIGLFENIEDAIKIRNDYIDKHKLLCKKS